MAKKKEKMAVQAAKKLKKKNPVVFYILLIVMILLIGLGVTWYLGIWDSYLPEAIQKSQLIDAKKQKNTKDDDDGVLVNGELQIYAIEMHDKYGDSLFIKYGDFDMLIDAGDAGDGAYVQDFVDSHISSDKNLDVLVVTHCHSDHLGGITNADKKALDNVSTISNIIDFGHSRASNSMYTKYDKIRSSYIKKGAKYYPAYEAVNHVDGLESVLTFGDLTIEIIDTKYYADKNTQLGSGTEFNDYSVATLITYKNVKMFCAGDLEDEGEASLVANAKNTSLNKITEENNVIYKMCHHGTDVGDANAVTNGAASLDGGNRMALLKYIKPDYVIVSSTIGESAHPYPRALATCLYFTDKVYFNGTNGTLCVDTDGKYIQITGAGATTNYKIDGIEQINYSAEKNCVYTDTLWYKHSKLIGGHSWYKGKNTVSDPTIKQVTEWYLEDLRKNYPQA